MGVTQVGAGIEEAGVTVVEGHEAETDTAAGRTETGHVQSLLLPEESVSASLALMSCHLVASSQALALSLEWQQQQLLLPHQRLLALVQHLQGKSSHLRSKRRGMPGVSMWEGFHQQPMSRTLPPSSAMPLLLWGAPLLVLAHV